MQNYGNIPLLGLGELGAKNSLLGVAIYVARKVQTNLSDGYFIVENCLIERLFFGHPRVYSDSLRLDVQSCGAVGVYVDITAHFRKV
jgi:hypothetical protein